MNGSTAQDFIPNEAYENNLARRGDDGDSVNDENYERTGEMLREVLPYANGWDKKRMETMGLKGLWPCWFRVEARKKERRMLKMFDDKNKVEIPF